MLPIKKENLKHYRLSVTKKTNTMLIWMRHKTEFGIMASL